MPRPRAISRTLRPATPLSASWAFPSSTMRAMVRSRARARDVGAAFMLRILPHSESSALDVGPRAVFTVLDRTESSAHIREAVMHRLVSGDGRIGRASIERALADGDTGTVLRRTAKDPSPGIRRVAGDVLDPASLEAAIDGADAVMAT